MNEESERKACDLEGVLIDRLSHHSDVVEWNPKEKMLIVGKYELLEENVRWFMNKR